MNDLVIQNVVVIPCSGAAGCGRGQQAAAASS